MCAVSFWPYFIHWYRSCIRVVCMIPRTLEAFSNLFPLYTTRTMRGPLHTFRLGPGRRLIRHWLALSQRDGADVLPRCADRQSTRLCTQLIELWIESNYVLMSVSSGGATGVTGEALQQTPLRSTHEIRPDPLSLFSRGVTTQNQNTSSKKAPDVQKKSHKRSSKFFFGWWQKNCNWRTNNFFLPAKFFLHPQPQDPGDATGLDAKYLPFGIAVIVINISVIRKQF